jgi:type I restriction enzyme S subunit
MTGTSGRQRVQTDLIANKTFFFPPVEEQRAIGQALSVFDDKIELLRNQNKTLESIAQQLFHEWFVEFNFPNIEGKPYKKSGGKMVDGELGEMPEGWRVGRFSDEVEIVMGQSPSGSSYNESRNGMIFFQGRAEFSDRFPKTRLYTTEPKKIAEQHDVLISVRAPVGDINVASERCCIGRGLAAVRGKYMSYTLHKTKSLKHEFDKYNSEGTVFGAINKTGMENIAVVIPAEEIIAMFETAVSLLDEKYYKNFLQIQNLTSIRESLLPRMMSGEICVLNKETYA